MTTRIVETETEVTTASGWQTLEFNFANQVGTAALNLALYMIKHLFSSILSNRCNGEKTYYFDDVAFERHQ
jgi:hypothetical protein